MKLISGLIIEGWKWGGSKKHSTVNWNSGVTHYSVEFSPDGRLWTVIKDENGLPRVRDINASLITLSLSRTCEHSPAYRFLLHEAARSITSPWLGC